MTNLVTGATGLAIMVAGALIVGTILHLRRETPATAIAAGAARRRDSVTTRTLAMTGI